MCLNPRMILNRALGINPTQGSLYQVCRCNKCEECIQENQDEWTVRAFYEYKKCSDRGGFSFFDTFTYNDASIPHHGHIKHFDSEHLKRFMNILRKRLKAAGYEVNQDTLKYLWVSEYGGQTHRPHYHAVFFCCIPNITPLQLRQYMSDIWSKKGILSGQTKTRGKKMRGLGLGFMDHLSTFNSRILDRVNAINYVCKYITKDYDFMRLLEDENTLGGLSKEQIGDLKNSRWQPFHRQSQGFGTAIIEYVDYEHMFNHHNIPIPSSSGYRFVKIPMYIQRKLWYRQVKNTDAEGKEHTRWMLTDSGLNYKLNKLDESINYLTKRYEMIYRSYETYADSDIVTAPYIIDTLNRLLDGRDWKDFAKYVLVYKGHFKQQFEIISQSTDYKDFYQYNLQEPLVKYESTLAVKGEEKYVGNYSLRDLCLFFTVDEFTHNDFRYFDTLFDFISSLSAGLGNKEQECYDKIQLIRSKYKLIQNAI